MWLFCILELGCNLMAYSCLYSALWSSEVDSWWTADHNKLELDIKTRWIRLAVPHYAIEVGCHKPMSDWNLTKYPAEIFMMLSCYRKPIHQNHKWVQNSSRKWVHNIFLNSCFKTRWVVEGGLYSVHRQKQLLLPLCNGNSMLSRPINVTLYDKTSLMCKNTPPLCLFLSNLRRQLLEIVWSSYLSILGGKLEKYHHF